MYEKLHQLKWVDGVLALGFIFLAVGIGMSVEEKLKPAKPELVKASVSPTSVVQVDIKVTFDIEGEVLIPGVYQLPKGSRISEALVKANGMSVNADREWVEKNINRAEVIRDGMKIYIPRKTESNQSESYKVESVTGLLININTANTEELDKLDGVGPAMAKKIVDYREKNGGFKNISEIKMVSGIGDKMFEKIKEQIEI